MDFDFTTIISIVFLAMFLIPMIRRIFKNATNPESGNLKQYHSSTEYRRRNARIKAKARRVPVVLRGKQNTVGTHAVELPARTAKPAVVMKFEPDMVVSKLSDYTRLIDEVVFNRNNIGEVIILVNSPGGSALHYAALYEQMKRIPACGLELTIIVDLVAASGGYLMSLPATRLLVSPQAIIGSIGVYSSAMNYRRLLEKHGIDAYWFVSGDVKVGVTGTNEVTEDKLSHTQTKIEETHEWFRDLVKRHRTEVDIATVSTGEIWRGEECVEKDLKLVDGLCTSAEYLQQLNESTDIITMGVRKTTSFGERLFGASARIFAKALVQEATTVMDRRLQGEQYDMQTRHNG